MQQLMKMGPKGQVVVPQEIRLKTNMNPGSSVLVREEHGRVYLEKAEDPLAVFERIAKKCGPMDYSKFDPHEAYDASMRSRMNVLSEGKCSI